LHDEVGQALTGVLAGMANLSTLIRAGDLDAVAAKAGEIKKQVEGSIRVMRNRALLVAPFGKGHEQEQSAEARHRKWRLFSGAASARRDMIQSYTSPAAQ